MSFIVTIQKDGGEERRIRVGTDDEEHAKWAAVVSVRPAKAVAVKVEREGVLPETPRKIADAVPTFDAEQAAKKSDIATAVGANKQTV